MIQKICICFVSWFALQLNAGELIRMSVDQPGNVVVIEEKSHKDGVSMVEMEIINPDAQGTAFALISALCGIALREEMTHFCVIRTDRKNGKEVKKVYFTSDITVDPSKKFRDEMDEESLSIYRQLGWSSVKQFAMFWPKAESNKMK